MKENETKEIAKKDSSFLYKIKYHLPCLGKKKSNEMKKKIEEKLKIQMTERLTKQKGG